MKSYCGGLRLIAASVARIIRAVIIARASHVSPIKAGLRSVCVLDGSQAREGPASSIRRVGVKHAATTRCRPSIVMPGSVGAARSRVAVSYERRFEGS